MPSLTVIMPAHNASAYVKSAVVSTLRALPRNGQLLICDDASTDGTSQILESIPDQRMRLFRNPERLGVAATLNALLDSVESFYVARMDADDVCLPWRFGVQRKSLRGGVEITFSPAVKITSKGTPKGLTSYRPLSAEQVKFRLLEANPLVHSTMFAITQSLARCGPYRDVGAEDYDLWLRLAASGKRITRTATPTLLYRIHPAQETQVLIDGERANKVWMRNPNLQASIESLRRSLTERRTTSS